MTWAVPPAESQLCLPGGPFREGAGLPCALAASFAGGASLRFLPNRFVARRRMSSHVGPLTSVKCPLNCIDPPRTENKSMFRRLRVQTRSGTGRLRNACARAGRHPPSRRARHHETRFGWPRPVLAHRQRGERWLGAEDSKLFTKALQSRIL